MARRRDRADVTGERSRLISPTLAEPGHEDRGDVGVLVVRGDRRRVVNLATLLHAAMEPGHEDRGDRSADFTRLTCGISTNRERSRTATAVRNAS